MVDQELSKKETTISLKDDKTRSAGAATPVVLQPPSKQALQAVSSGAAAMIPRTCLLRQDENAQAQPGAIRMVGATPDVGNTVDDQTVADVEAPPPPPAEEQTPRLETVESACIEAELVAEISPKDLQNHDIESSGIILTAAPVEDKHMLLHFVQQRRVQVLLLLLVLCMVGITVGMVVGLSREQEDDLTAVVMIDANGTQTTITDKDQIELLVPSASEDGV